MNVTEMKQKCDEENLDSDLFEELDSTEEFNTFGPDVIPVIEVLMVLPRRTIHGKSPINKQDSILIKTEQRPDTVKFKIFDAGIQVGEAWIIDSDEFGMQRPRLKLLLSKSLADQPEKMPDSAYQLTLISALLFEAGKEFDKTPGRYPLYIRASGDELGMIAAASRLGFIPYFGEWNESTAKQSEWSWQTVTELLRKQFPEGI